MYVNVSLCICMCPHVFSCIIKQNNQISNLNSCLFVYVFTYLYVSCILREGFSNVAFIAKVGVSGAGCGHRPAEDEPWVHLARGQGANPAGLPCRREQQPAMIFLALSLRGEGGGLLPAQAPSTATPPPSVAGTTRPRALPLGLCVTKIAPVII